MAVVASPIGDHELADAQRRLTIRTSPIRLRQIWLMVPPYS
jgi:hypothetical protein